MKKVIYVSLVSSVLLSGEVRLEPVVVSATKVSQSIEDTTTNTQVITSLELKERRYATVVDALNSLAGIGFTQDGGAGSMTKLYIRGMGGNRVLVLVDGIRYDDPSNKFGADFSRLMMSDIERIEMNSGAGSGVWGANASAGVINIVTKEAKKGFHSGGMLGGGSFNTTQLQAYASYKTDRYSAKLSIVQFNTDGFSAQAPYADDIELYEDDGYENRTINLSLGYKITKNDILSLKYQNIYAKNNYDLIKKVKTDGKIVMKSFPDADLELKTDTNLATLNYIKTISNHKISLRYNISDFKRDDVDAITGVKDYVGRVDELEIHDTISYRKKDFILVGSTYKEEKVEYKKVDKTSNNYNIYSNALFITNTNYIDNLTITQSFRRDSYSGYDAKKTGKVGLKYQLEKGTFLSSNCGTAYNAPSMMMMLNPMGKENKNLEAEDTNSFDITASYKYLSLTYFHSTVENLISYNKTNKQHINIDGISSFKGVEVKYALDIYDDIFIKLNYTYLSAKDKDGNELRRRVKNHYKGIVDYYLNDELSFNLNGEYIGERYDDMYSKKDPSKTRGRQTGKYFVANFVTGYKFNKNFTTYLKVNNFFDKYYQVVDGYTTSPRAFYLGLNAKF